MAKLRYMSRDDFRVLTAVRSSPFLPVLYHCASSSWKFTGSWTLSGHWNAAEVGNGAKTIESEF